jgi:NitT/TauT family transport system permease protein
MENRNRKEINEDNIEIKTKKSWIGILAFLILLIFWEISSRLHLIHENIFPDPLTVGLSFIELIKNGTLVKHTIASLFRVTIGFYTAIATGIPVAILIGRNQILYDFLNPIIQFLRPISPLAWIPIAMLLFGIGDPPAIFLIYLSSFFPIVVSTAIAVGNINPIYFQVASNFDFTKTEIITKLILPAILPDILTVLRITITIAWLVVVAAEMIAVQSGLGFLILDSRNALRMDYVLCGMIMIGLIGLSLDHIMKKISKVESISWNLNIR